MGASRIRPLTAKEVERIAASRPTCIKHHTLGGVPGFVLAHTPAGHSSYGLIYFVNRRRRKLTLGSAKTLSLAEARKLAAQYRARVEAGGDPHGEKIAARQRRVEEEDLAAEAMWAKYLALAASQLRSRGEKDRIFRRYLLPFVRGLSVTELRKKHALAVVDPLVAAGKLRMADKVRQEGAAWCQWLLEREHIERNPFAGIRKAQIGRNIRTRVLSDEELKQIWKAAEPEGRWGQWIKLLILTGARNAEARGARWSEFDLQSRVWTIPASRSKNKQSHQIHLTSAILDILAGIPIFPDIDLLFPQSRSARKTTMAGGSNERMINPMSGDQKVKDRIDARMRLAMRRHGVAEPQTWQLHDFRRTIATGLQRLGFRPDIADQVIGHVSSTRSGAAAHYLHHKYEDEKKIALEAWSQHLLSLFGLALSRMRDLAA